MMPNYVHCLFEQSGTFKNEFIKLGIPAADYDIQNNFGETDHVVDLFAEIEKAYHGEESMFDKIGSDDLVLAFFPCIHFSQAAVMFYRCETWNLRNDTQRKKTQYAIDKMKNCNYFFGLIKKLECIVVERGIKLIIENPWTFSMLWLLMRKPDVIDTNRHKHGDYFSKPTAYWFYNFKPAASKFHSDNNIKTLHKTVEKSKSAPMAGLCSEDRSMISSDYARNFICDFILGKPQHNTQLNLFERKSDYLTLTDITH